MKRCTIVGDEGKRMRAEGQQRWPWRYPEKHSVIDLVTDLVAGWDIDLMDGSLTNSVVYGMDTDVEVDSSVE